MMNQRRRFAFRLLPLLVLLPVACASDNGKVSAPEVRALGLDRQSPDQAGTVDPVDPVLHDQDPVLDSTDEGRTHSGFDDLPVRQAEPETTTGGVPHIQTSADPVTELTLDLARRAYSLPGVENRESVISLPGAMSLWLSDEIELVRPDVLAAGREFGHIHPDGSMHLWLQSERAVEVAKAQWGELHPWVSRDGFWDGVVMVWTPESAEDVDISVRLIVDAYNLVAGTDLDAADFT